MFENVYGFTLKYPNSSKRRKIAYSETVIEKLHKLGYADARGEMIDMSEYGVPQRRKRFIVIATREGSANKIYDELKNGREEFFRARGLQSKNSSKSVLSDIEREHGSVVSRDTKGFMAGLSSESENSFQKYLRVPGEEVYAPDSHRFVNHTPTTQQVHSPVL